MKLSPKGKLSEFDRWAGCTMLHAYPLALVVERIWRDRYSWMHHDLD